MNVDLLPPCLLAPPAFATGLFFILFQWNFFSMETLHLYPWTSLLAVESFNAMQIEITFAAAYDFNQYTQYVPRPGPSQPRRF